MASSASARKLTYDDYVSFPDDGQRHELIDGEHYVSPPPITIHQRLSVRLTVALGRYFDAHPGSEVFHAPCGVKLSRWDAVEPDLFVVLEDQSGIVTEKNVDGAPAMVIEILSPSTRRYDEAIKRAAYDRFGVREYWIVDPVSAAVTVHRRATGGDLRAMPALTRTQAGVLTSPLLPGWSLVLTALFK
jgi:Uma2 family endonuclease